MSGMADQDDVIAHFVMPFGLAMDLADQWAGGVEIKHGAPFGFGWHDFGDAMGGTDDRCVGWHLVQLIDENRAALFQPLDDKAIMDDLVTHIARGAVFFERPLDDLNGAVDA